MEIERDISRARSLPAEAYTCPAQFERQRERVLARSWQLVPPDLPMPSEPGAVPFLLLPGTLDEPLVLSRTGSGELHCLSNVCTHRGNLVVEAAGPCPELRCRYHGRRFALDGGMTFMPEFDGVEGFPGDTDSLPRLPLESWQELLFVGFRPAGSFFDLLGAARDRLSFLPMDRARIDDGSRREYEVSAHWALYCDNYLEGFHIPYVHRSLHETLDYGDYRTELLPGGVLQIGISGDPETIFALPPEHPDAGQSVAAYYLWLFPNTMLNFYPWGCSVNVVRPLAPDRTRISYYAMVWDASRRRSGAGVGLDRVEAEDDEVVESVARGVASRLYRRGRYSPRRETGVHHFHRLLSDALRT